MKYLHAHCYVHFMLFVDPIWAGMGTACGLTFLATAGNIQLGQRAAAT